jgi:Rrf2 family protein
MSVKSIQFAVCTHIATMLGFWHGEAFTSSQIADSMNAEPSYVRRAIAKLAKTGIVATTRGKSGACMLARAPESITLLDIYRAAEAPPAALPHAYRVQEACPVSMVFQPSLSHMLDHAQAAFEAALSQRTVADLVADIRAAHRAAGTREFGRPAPRQVA